MKIGMEIGEGQMGKLNVNDLIKSDTSGKYSVQIFAEMLGQVCHEEFYKNAMTEYQEIFSYFLER